MKFICLLIVALLINFQNIFSQNYQTPSCDMIDNNESTLSRTMALAGSSGAYKPAKNSAGEYFRVLIAFAQFDSDVEPNPVWPLNQLPTWANSFIDNTVLSTYSDETLSDFFDEASHGSFDFIGDIYPNLVHITSDKSYGEANLDVITELNINITDFSRYDNWDLTGSSYIFSEGSGDGYLDMLIIIYRRKHSTLGLSGGISTLNLASDFTTHDGKVIKGGYYPSKERGGITSVNKFSPKFDYITHIAHEFGHYLFGVNHTIQGGLMAGTQSNEMPSYYGSTYMMSGWEREWLRYTNYIVPTTDGQEITIGDFVETGDVIKIPIPFNNPTSSTFFVIENHQRLSKYDQINKGGEFEGNYNFTTVGSGIYIWLITNGNNWVPSVDIKTADGSWDWALDGTISMPSGWPATMPLAKRTAVNRNTGKSDRNVLNIYWNGQWWDKWHENINPNISSPPTSNYILNRDVFGDGTDAFNLAYNQLFTPWSNPSSYAGGTSNISLELISNNAGMYNVKVYSTDASALALPPSKPQDFFASYNSSNQTVLTWAGNTETDLASYKIYRAKTTGGVPSTYQYLATVAGTTTTYTDTTFIGDQAYKVFYKITAVDNTNKESIQSDYSFINYLSANITTSTSICGNIIAYNDINIPSGVTLTIITNTTNPIAKLNLLNNSVLNVYGQLTSTTTWNPNKVIFDFQSPFISEQKINGIRLYPGSFFYVYAAHFKNAYCGIICKDCSPYQGNFLYTNCFFENMEVIGGSITSTYLQGHYLVEENLIVAGNDLTIDPPSYFLFLNGSSLISNGELYINGG
ncbi:MAG: hypothetical protein NTX22_15860, partial [Ignavibacteriales bacterium]|nr:hypothetical protein [Ignavibacteriales bacterium]